MSDLLSVQGPEFPIGKLSESKIYICTLRVYFFIVATVKLDSSFKRFFFFNDCHFLASQKSFVTLFINLLINLPD